MKAICDLINDQDACRQIFESISWGEYERADIFRHGGGGILLTGVHYEGYRIELILYSTGNIFFMVDGVDDDFGSAFALVDKIRSLGYSA